MEVFLPLALGFCMGVLLTVGAFIIVWKHESSDVRTHQESSRYSVSMNVSAPGQYVPSTCKLHPLRNIGRKEV